MEKNEFSRSERNTISVYNKIVVAAEAALAREEKTECGCTQLVPCFVCCDLARDMREVLKEHGYPYGYRGGYLTAEAHDCAVQLYAQLQGGPTRRRRRYAGM